MNDPQNDSGGEWTIWKVLGLMIGFIGMAGFGICGLCGVYIGVNGGSSDAQIVGLAVLGLLIAAAFGAMVWAIFRSVLRKPKPPDPS
ncbi:MAG: hypothetical protein LBE59_06470 [Nevskiaceae bacterium]|jgi:hypothetical protein|nr:hypothetical protein [Nevskiaceae bacterium]